MPLANCATHIKIKKGHGVVTMASELYKLKKSPFRNTV